MKPAGPAPVTDIAVGEAARRGVTEMGTSHDVRPKGRVTPVNVTMWRAGQLNARPSTISRARKTSPTTERHPPQSLAGRSAEKMDVNMDPAHGSHRIAGRKVVSRARVPGAGAVQNPASRLVASRLP